MGPLPRASNRRSMGPTNANKRYPSKHRRSGLCGVCKRNAFYPSKLLHIKARAGTGSWHKPRVIFYSHTAYLDYDMANNTLSPANPLPPGRSRWEPRCQPVPLPKDVLPPVSALPPTQPAHALAPWALPFHSRLTAICLCILIRRGLPANVPSSRGLPRCTSSANSSATFHLRFSRFAFFFTLAHIAFCWARHVECLNHSRASFHFFSPLRWARDASRGMCLRRNCRCGGAARLRRAPPSAISLPSIPS